MNSALCVDLEGCQQEKADLRREKMLVSVSLLADSIAVYMHASAIENALQYFFTTSLFTHPFSKRAVNHFGQSTLYIESLNAQCLELYLVAPNNRSPPQLSELQKHSSVYFDCS